jgi:hypothetical protein
VIITISMLSLLIDCIHLEHIQAMKIPKIGPPIDRRKNLISVTSRSKLPVVTTSLQTRKKTKATPSFKWDSPSRSVLNLTEVSSSFNKAITAIGSVVLMIELLICKTQNIKYNYLRNNKCLTYTQFIPVPKQIDQCVSYE